jgi:predicted nucleic acid-binding protein
MSAYVDTSVLGAYYCPEKLSSAAEAALRVIDEPIISIHVSEGFYRRINLTGEHYLKARQLIAAMQIPLHTLDALHLAAAMAESVPLLTAEKGLAEAAKRHGSEVILIKMRGKPRPSGRGRIAWTPKASFSGEFSAARYTVE